MEELSTDHPLLFSVVIPTYRRNDLLARCLDALAPGVQTLPADRYEVVVTDDDSEGKNPQAMLAERYPWARWTHVPRRGPAAVYGRIGLREVRTLADRWCARHLYRTCEVHEPRPTKSLITWGVMLRVAAVREVGNFAPACRHSEDAELGDRLTAAGWTMVYEPSAGVETLVSNTVSQVLERWWRWNAGVAPRYRFVGHLRLAWYAAKVMAAQDLRAGDPAAALLSLAAPHIAAWRTLRSR